MYELCSLIKALGRHPTTGPYEELRKVFVEVDYSYARTRAAVAMANVDANFVNLFAHECLWDCEPDTQATGIAAADSTEAKTASRFRQLATSGVEDQKVALAAGARLSQL